MLGGSGEAAAGLRARTGSLQGVVQGRNAGRNAGYWERLRSRGGSGRLGRWCEGNEEGGECLFIKVLGKLKGLEVAEEP